MEINTETQIDYSKIMFLLQRKAELARYLQALRKDHSKSMNVMTKVEIEKVDHDLMMISDEVNELEKEALREVEASQEKKFKFMQVL